MKLTLTNIKKLKRDNENELFKRVCDYVIDQWDDYSVKINIFTDVLYHGCQSGVVGFLIYYSDTIEFFEEYKKEISELLRDIMDATGITAMGELFGTKWEQEDPLALEPYNQNLLAWFGFEEMLRELGEHFDELEDCI